MELSRGEILCNEVILKYNSLLVRFEALQKELEEAKTEGQGWKRKFLSVQQTVEVQKEVK